MKKALALTLAIYAISILFSMAAMSLGAALVFVALATWFFSGEARRSASGLLSSPALSGYAWVSLLLAGACLVSLLGLKFTPIRIEGFDPIEVSWGRDLAKLWYFAWAPLLAIALGALQPQQERKVWKAWVWAFGLVSLVGCIQFFVGWPRPQSLAHLEGRYHATLFLGHHLSVASIWIFPFFACLAAIFSKPIRERWGVGRPLVGIAALLGLATLILTFSRMLWLALPVGFGIYFLIFRSRPNLGRVAFLAAAMVVAVGAAWQIPVVRERMMSSMGTHERYDLWRVNWRFFLDRPLSGSGWHHNLQLAGQVLRRERPEGYIFVGHAHNNAIDVLGSMGILGFMTWLAWNAWFCVQLGRLSFGGGSSPWVRDLARAWLAAFVVFHLNGLTQVNFWEGKVQHHLFWMMGWVLLWRYRHGQPGHASAASS